MQSPAGNPLSAKQWQALGRLADRYQRVEEAGEFLSREFGGTLTERTLEWAELAQDPRLGHTLHEVIETMTVLAESDILKKLRELALFVSESETYLDTDGLVGSLIRNLRKLPVATLGAAWRDANIASEHKATGGWGGLFRIMRDPEVQTGLVVMGRFLDALHTTAVKSGEDA
jgi:uncharacterized protein YjgD (DUF1641 family)